MKEVKTIFDIKSPLFRCLKKKELGFLSQGLIHIVYRKGEIIRKQGTFLSHVVILASGYAKVYLEGYNNQDIIIRIIKPSNMIGGPGMYYDKKHHYTVRALTSCDVLFCDVEKFKELLHSNKCFSGEFLKDFSINALNTYDKLIFQIQKNAKGRLAAGLLYLAEQIFNNYQFEFLINKNDLADLTGISPDNVMRILRDLKDNEIIHIDKKQLAILKPEALKNIAEEKQK